MTASSTRDPCCDQPDQGQRPVYFPDRMCCGRCDCRLDDHRILASYAQEVSLSASENVKWRTRLDFRNGKPGNLRVIGYDLINGRLVINEKEAEMVRMIFADYLSGMGKTAIANKLQELGVPTKTNSKWMISTIHSILRDEKYTGNMLLQKTYRKNHLTKIKKFNTGELPQYYVEDSHEAIISQDLFDMVQSELARRETMHKSLILLFAIGYGHDKLI